MTLHSSNFMVCEAKLLNFSLFQRHPITLSDNHNIHTFYYLSKLNCFLPFLLSFNYFLFQLLIWSPFLTLSMLRLGVKYQSLFCSASSMISISEMLSNIWRIHKANRRKTEMWAVSLSWKKGPAVQCLGSFFWKGYRKTPSLSVNSKPWVFDNSWLK